MYVCVRHPLTASCYVCVCVCSSPINCCVCVRLHPLAAVQVRRISQVDEETEIIFNCQMGRGRTTTGMVIATLVYLNRIGASGNVFLLKPKKIVSFVYFVSA